MKDLKDIKNIISRYRRVIADRFKVKEMALFGSYVRNENKADSDVDILVEFSEPIGFFAFLDLEEYLEKLLGLKVDVVSKKALKPRIGEQILKEAVPV